jgi:hypothetical protein
LPVLGAELLLVEPETPVAALGKDALDCVRETLVEELAVLFLLMAVADQWSFWVEEGGLDL